MDDSERVAALEDRIDKLEALTKKMMPSRRDALKLGGAAAIGAAAMSGTASAGSNQVGTIGDANNLVDIEAEDVTINDTLNGASISGAAQDEALLSDGAGGLTFAEAGGGVPPNFSYSNEVINRDVNTVYTNNTGKALFVSAVVQIENNYYRPSFTSYGLVDGSAISVISLRFRDISQDWDEFSSVTHTFLVPNGSTYEIDVLGFQYEIDRWFEAEL